MKKVAAVILLFAMTSVVYNLSYAQQADSIAVLHAKADSLEGVISSAQEELEELQNSIAEAEREQRISAAQSDNGYEYVGVLSRDAAYFSRPSLNSDRLGLISKGKSLPVLSEEETFYKVFFQDREAYVRKSAVDLDGLGESLWIRVWESDVREAPRTDSDVVTTLRRGTQVNKLDSEGTWIKISYNGSIGGDTAWIEESVVSNTRVTRPTPNTLRRRSFVENHSNLSTRHREAILSGRVALGMNKSMVRASLGRPDNINRTTASWGTREQWVYRQGRGRLYIYFRDGVVETIQD